MTKTEDTISILDIPSSQLTPGMRQYQDAKRENPDCIIMLRMGDFYELFYEDAITSARELEITLTARGKGEKKAPLAGVPYHALEPYLGKLVKRGYKVAIVEQLEDPKKAKGLVKRGLVRIVTPGTVIESSILNEKENNFIISITQHSNEFALAGCDLSTGEFFTSSIPDTSSLINELTRHHPKECIIPTTLTVNKELITTIKNTGTYINTFDDYYFKPENASKTLLSHFNTPALDTFGLQDSPLLQSVAGSLLQYLLDTQKNSLTHIKRLTLQSNQHTMLLDAATFRNLELTTSIRDGSKKSTLLSILDHTVTAMGARLLQKWLKQPLLNQTKIQSRLDAVEELTQQIILREELNTLLKKIADIERLIGRVNYGTASPRDLLSLHNSLSHLPQFIEKLSSSSTELLKKIYDINPLNEITTLLSKAIREDSPITIREGGFIKSEYDQQLKELTSITKNSKQFLTQIEEREKKATGIQSLKIKYNRVFGYFIEVTKKNIPSVPDHYIRKQTTANGERYITDELKQEEEKILGAQEKIHQLEYKLFQDILQQVAQHTATIQTTARKLAVLDCLISLAKVAIENNYCKPQLTDNNTIHIKNGRHPVVEQTESRFVPNDLFIQPGEMMIITGPNMAGKSTVMRQTALIVLLAQIGSFVPAEECSLSIVDRIFTRVGASDDLSSGQSTFMVEMYETASILNNATENSLIILDEIGRGTSTFDGVSIAWSVAEFIYNHIKAKTMFATHYHVMNKLETKFANIKNYNIAVKEKNGEVIFLRKLLPGGTDESYGIHVAKLAGLPETVLSRAKEIQTILEKDDDMVKKIKAKKLQEQMDLGNFT